MHCTVYAKCYSLFFNCSDMDQGGGSFCPRLQFSLLLVLYSDFRALRCLIEDDIPAFGARLCYQGVFLSSMRFHYHLSNGTLGSRLAFLWCLGRIFFAFFYSFHFQIECCVSTFIISSPCILTMLFPWGPAILWKICVVEVVFFWRFAVSFSLNASCSFFRWCPPCRIRP